MDDSPSALNQFAAGMRIIVAGAGIAGLSFVIALRKQRLTSCTHITVTVYERDPREVSIEREGYSLSIRSDGLSGGMQALNKLGLLDSMPAASYTGSQGNAGGFTLWDKDWNEIMKMKSSPIEGLPAPSMRIARNVLRRMLVDAVSSEDTIHWMTTCTGVAQLPSGKVQVQLSNGQVDDCDLLVAADGAHSRIRSILRPDDNLSFAAAVCIAGNSRFLSGVPEPVNRDWGCVLSGNGTGLFVSPVDQHSAVWSVSYLAEEPRKRMKPPLSNQDIDCLIRESLDRGKSFAQPFRTLVQATDPSTLMVLNAVDKQPFSHAGRNQKPVSVVFIGDSNHAVSPFAGNGANMALMDGWELAEQICKSNSLPDALAAYDASSMPRSKSTVRMSHWSIALAHAQGWKLTLYIYLLRLVKLFF
ncbi:hypothetical protein V1517DRAFT_205173 [Lipomyces orientalis]|uniref:Uncharacterized protein n=1 Tax=Lipomyces orientalis TaxID=1233043 RepID=A0ACC3THC4_9ASCO